MINHLNINFIVIYPAIVQYQTCNAAIILVFNRDYELYFFSCVYWASAKYILKFYQNKISPASKLGKHFWAESNMLSYQVLMVCLSVVFICNRHCVVYELYQVQSFVGMYYLFPVSQFFLPCILFGSQTWSINILVILGYHRIEVGITLPHNFQGIQ